jgi:hypothetical protein
VAGRGERSGQAPWCGFVNPDQYRLWPGYRATAGSPRRRTHQPWRPAIARVHVSQPLRFVLAERFRLSASGHDGVPVRRFVLKVRKVRGVNVGFVTASSARLASSVIPPVVHYVIGHVIGPCSSCRQGIPHLRCWSTGWWEYFTRVPGRKGA